MDDVVLNEAAIIERCVARVCEEYDGDERNLVADQRRQDSIITDHLDDFLEFARVVLGQTA